MLYQWSRKILAVQAAVLLIAGSGCAGNAGGSSSLPESRRILPAQTVTFSQFADLPTNQFAPYFPFALTTGADGALWVADDVDQDFGASAVARIDVTGRRTATFFYPNQSLPSALDITMGPDRALWIADSGDFRVLRMTTTGNFTGYHLPNAQAPAAITSGPDGALWFTVSDFPTFKIGRITTSGQIRLFSTGISSGEQLLDIAAGPDGALWFTEARSAGIGRITTSGTITEYRKGITPGSEPHSIVLGPDGALWFTETVGGRIGRITAAGAVTEYSSGISEHPVDIAAGPDGALWFTESHYGPQSKIGRITTSGTVTEYSGIPPGSNPVCIVRDRTATCGLPI